MKKYVSPSLQDSPLKAFSYGRSASSEFSSGFMKGFGFGSSRMIPEELSSLEACIDEKI